MRHNYRGKYKNVEIRQLNEDDLEFLRNWRNNSDNTKFLRKISYITPEMQKAWFQSYLNDKTEMTFAIDEKEVVQQVVGSMSLYDFAGTKAEVGKILVGNPNAHGMNVCVNALKAAMEIARRDLELKKLFLHVYENNIIAIKAYKKVGFSVESERVLENGLLEYTMSIDL